MADIGRVLMYGIVTLASLSILHIFVWQNLYVYLVPKLQDIVTGSLGGTLAIDAVTQGQILSGFNYIIMYLNYLPYILYGMVILFMFVKIVKEERPDGV